MKERFFHAAKDRSESLPFTRTWGTRRVPSSRMVIGQISDSAMIARSGFQWSRKRLTAGFRSSGTYWCSTLSPNFSRTRCAEVTVPVVKTTLMPKPAMRRTSGITAFDSPTLAACTQTSGPGGRATLEIP